MLAIAYKKARTAIYIGMNHVFLMMRGNSCAIMEQRASAAGVLPWQLRIQLADVRSSVQNNE